MTGASGPVLLQELTRKLLTDACDAWRMLNF